MTAWIEAFLYLSIVTLGLVLAIMGLLSLNGCIWLSMGLLAGLMLLAWRRFDGGRHPCFLFLSTLLIFQGGRLVGWVMGVVQQPMRIDLATAVPLDVSKESAELTLLVIVLSAICVYFPCRLNYRSSRLLSGRELFRLPSLYALIVLTFPFALYKNLMYLLYVRSHGGYLVVFTDNAAVLQSAGPVARIVSVICAVAMSIAYVLERRPRRVALLVGLYFSLSILDLFIGFRGKVFTELLTFWFIYNLKTGRRFALVPVLVIALLMNVVAVGIAAYREDNRIKIISPAGFLAGEGISLNVTEAAIEFHDRFSKHGISYIAGGFTAGISPLPGNDEGRLWTTDLTIFLNPMAAKLGFGTASSYLAELYLFAGIPAVIFGSIAIGYCLAALHNISSTNWGAIVLALVLPSLIYLPRLELLNPIATLIKSLTACAVIWMFVICHRWADDVIRWKYERHLVSDGA